MLRQLKRNDWRWGKTYASEGDLGWPIGDFDEAEHEVGGLVRGIAGVAAVVGCRSTAWPYLGPGWERSRTWRVGGGAGRRGGSMRP